MKEETQVSAQTCQACFQSWGFRHAHAAWAWYFRHSCRILQNGSRPARLSRNTDVDCDVVVLDGLERLMWHMDLGDNQSEGGEGMHGSDGSLLNGRFVIKSRHEMPRVCCRVASVQPIRQSSVCQRPKSTVHLMISHQCVIFLLPY